MYFSSLSAQLMFNIPLTTYLTTLASHLKSASLLRCSSVLMDTKTVEMWRKYLTSNSSGGHKHNF